ncbi:MAG: acyl carrier protein [Gaiellaceae bacterium]
MKQPTLIRLQTLFAEVVGVEPPAPDVDVIAGGLLDSLALVELLLAIDQQLGIEIPPAKLDIERFRTLERLAALVVECGGIGASDAA